MGAVEVDLRPGRIAADRDEAVQTAKEWGQKAAAASSRAEQLRTEDAERAEHFDEPARVALRRQITYEQQVETFERQIAQQTVMLRRREEEPVGSKDGKGGASKDGKSAEAVVKKEPPKSNQQGNRNAGSRKKRRKR